MMPMMCKDICSYVCVYLFDEISKWECWNMKYIGCEFGELLQTLNQIGVRGRREQRFRIGVQGR